MAIDKWWTGNAYVIPQVVEFHVAAVVNSADYTVTINGLSVTYTSDSSATAQEIINGLYALLSVHNDPRIATLTFQNLTIPGPDYAIQVTGRDDGTPFTITYLGSGGAALANLAFIHGASPSDWAAIIDPVGTYINWTGGTLPGGGSNVLIDNSDSDIVYSLNRSGDGTLASLTFGGTFTGTVGMPSVPSNLQGFGYWNPPYLVIHCTTVNIGGGGGSGSGRIKLDLINGYSATVNVFSTGSGLEEGIEAVLIRSSTVGDTHVVNVISGSVGIAVLTGDVAGVATLRVSGDAKVRVGVGAAVGTLNQEAGSVTLLCGATTINKIDGTLTVFGTGAATNLTENGGRTVWNSSGNITNLIVGDGGVVDFSGDIRPLTVTNCTIEAGGSIIDPFRRVAFSNGVILNEAKIKDLPDLDLGTHIKLTIAAGP
jgi:hypothetical protein